jgi:hypothetical protein
VEPLLIAWTSCEKTCIKSIGLVMLLLKSQIGCFGMSLSTRQMSVHVRQTVIPINQKGLFDHPSLVSQARRILLQCNLYLLKKIFIIIISLYGMKFILWATIRYYERRI